MSASKVNYERFFSTKDVSVRLGIHKNTVLKYVKAGKFGRVLRLEQDIRFPESSIQKFIEERMA
jgi:hypothetical protein